MRQQPAMLQRFWKDSSGVAMIEFAFLLPVLMILFYGIVEVSRLVQMQEKTANAAHAIGDLINQNFNVSNAMLADYASTLPSLVAPFDTDGVGMVVTAVQVPTGDTQPVTIWQRSYGEARASHISGGEGAKPTLPVGLDLQSDDQVIAVEIFLDYQPIMDNDTVRSLLGVAPDGVYKVSIARPRYGAFQLPPA